MCWCLWGGYQRSPWAPQPGVDLGKIKKSPLRGLLPTRAYVALLKLVSGFFFYKCFYTSAKTRRFFWNLQPYLYDQMFINAFPLRQKPGGSFETCNLTLMTKWHTCYIRRLFPKLATFPIWQSCILVIQGGSFEICNLSYLAKLHTCDTRWLFPKLQPFLFEMSCVVQKVFASGLNVNYTAGSVAKIALAFCTGR